MIVKNNRLYKNLNIFSNGCMLTTYNYTNLTSKLLVKLTEKDFKSFEKKSKNGILKNVGVSNISNDYRKKFLK